MIKTEKPAIKTLGELKASGYESTSIKDELRNNLIEKMSKKEKVFDRVLGYDDTVIPDIERAILSKHSVNLLGLRGQAKTSIARAMTNLLDEWIPVIEGSDLNDDPFQPLSRYAKDVIAEKGDDTPIDWLHREERYTEKLATPDVTIADLIGDVDPIKAANLKLSYSDERVIHFGLVPNSNRCIFVINELPDLQARIQVALFNILQEGDIQIRGFKLRLPLDIQFVFTANPEDYTNRGSIITPLKDRIQSQIITHYPKSIEIAKQITQQEARITDEQRKKVSVAPLLEDMIEHIAFVARESEYIDQKSGVSARLTISAFENLVAAAERRTLVNTEKKTNARISDLLGAIPAITGKVELVYEGEQEGAISVAYQLIAQVIRKVFPQHFPDPDMIKRKKQENPYATIINWFSTNEVDLVNDLSNRDYEKTLSEVPGLIDLVKKYHPKANASEQFLYMELVLHGLAEYSLISKNVLDTGLSFKDIMNSMFSFNRDDDFDYDE
ncbi:MAG: magnesium chelatase [Crocinitomicaceae bacterium]|nr:magnesium chelatase [Crocinitomicaceae bacterium]|tara:strand:- start:1444 stop:2940 length:1497 start_codon:yes stop_codon:yes gene_type:complete